MSSAPQHKPQLDFFLKWVLLETKTVHFFQLLKLNESFESLNGLCNNNSSRKLVILGH